MIEQTGMHQGLTKATNGTSNNDVASGRPSGSRVRHLPRKCRPWSAGRKAYATANNGLDVTDLFGKIIWDGGQRVRASDLMHVGYTGEML